MWESTQHKPLLGQILNAEVETAETEALYNPKANVWQQLYGRCTIRASAPYRVGLFTFTASTVCTTALAALAGLAGQVHDVLKARPLTTSFPWMGRVLMLTLPLTISNELGMATLRHLGIESPGLFYLVTTFNGCVLYKVTKVVLSNFQLILRIAKWYSYNRRYSQMYAKRIIGSLIVCSLLFDCALMALHKKYTRPTKKQLTLATVFGSPRDGMIPKTRGPIFLTPHILQL